MSTKNKGYPLPDNINPPEEVGFCVPVPDEPAYLQAFWGQMSELGAWGMWHKDGTHAAVDAATRWRDSYRRITSCEPQEPCEECPDECMGDCGVVFLAEDPHIDYAPNDPFRTPDHVPSGYLLPPWTLDEGRPATGLTSLPIGIFNPIAILSGFPRFKVHCKGDGTVLLYLRKVPQGGYAYITVDGNPAGTIVDMATWSIFDFDGWADVLAPIIGLITGNENPREIVEVQLEGSGDHYIDVTFLPKLSAIFILTGFGGQLEKVKVCTDEPQEVIEEMPPEFRVEDCVLQWRPNSDADWVILQDLCDCDCEAETEDFCWLWSLTDESHGFTGFDGDSGHWEEGIGWVDGVDDDGLRKADIVSEAWAAPVRVRKVTIKAQFEAGEDGANHFIQLHTETGWVTILDDDSPSEGSEIEIVVNGQWNADQIRVRLTSGDDEDGLAAIYSIQIDADMGENPYPELPCEGVDVISCWLWSLTGESHGFIGWDVNSGHWEEGLGWVDGVDASGLRKADIESEVWANTMRVTSVKVTADFTAGEDGANHFIQLHTETGWVTILDDDSPDTGTGIEIEVTGSWVANQIRVRLTSGNDSDGLAQIYGIQIETDQGVNPYPELECEEEPPPFDGCVDFENTAEYEVIKGEWGSGFGEAGAGVQYTATAIDDWLSQVIVTIPIAQVSAGVTMRVHTAASNSDNSPRNHRLYVMGWNGSAYVDLYGTPPYGVAVLNADDAWFDLVGTWSAVEYEHLWVQVTAGGNVNSFLNLRVDNICLITD